MVRRKHGRVTGSVTKMLGGSNGNRLQFGITAYEDRRQLATPFIGFADQACSAGPPATQENPLLPEPPCSPTGKSNRE